MGPASLLQIAAAATFLLSTSVLARDPTQASQKVIANTANSDQIQDYKALFDGSAEQTVQNTSVPVPGHAFDGAIKWTDVIDSVIPADLDTVCTESCLACAPGCDPICCLDGGGRPPHCVKSALSSCPSYDRRASVLHQPSETLGCPCNCEASCPASIQAICCVTPGSGAVPPSADDASGGETDGDNEAPETTQQAQKPQPQPAAKKHLPPTRSNVNVKVNGIPPIPDLGCPCHCEASCPASVQAICCYTTGSGASRNEAGNSSTNTTEPEPDSAAVLALVTQTSSGDTVAILATTNFITFDSYITMDLVLGLGQGNEITYNADSGTFQIVLAFVVGSSADGKDVFRLTFRVVDGSKLWEREQVLLGVGALVRIGAVQVKKDVQGDEVMGVPFLTGSKSKAK